MPIQGTGNSLTLMGKTTLFSRVALSPNATMGDGGKKGGAFNLQQMSKSSGGGAPSSMEMETQASTTGASAPAQQPVGAGTMGKTFKSSTQTSTFRDAIQKGVLSGAGVLKK